MRVCVSWVWCFAGGHIDRHLQESTGLIDPLTCVFAHSQGVGLGRNTTYLQRVWPVCVCARVCVCREGVTGAQMSECVSVRCRNRHTYIQTHVLLHPTGTGSDVCAYDSSHKKLLFWHKFYGPSAKSYELCNVETLTDQDQMWLCVHGGTSILTIND